MYKFKDSFDQDAIVTQAIHPYCSGRVQFRGSWWPARCPQNVSLNPGQVCHVVDIHNITLIVEPIPLTTDS